MEPTIPISIYYFFIYYVFLIPSINTISYFEARSLEIKKKIKNRGREGYSSKSHWNFYFIHWKNPFCY